MIDQLRLLRDQIDALDASIVKLLKERVEVSRKIGTTK